MSKTIYRQIRNHELKAEALEAIGKPGHFWPARRDGIVWVDGWHIKLESWVKTFVYRTNSLYKREHRWFVCDKATGMVIGCGARCRYDAIAHAKDILRLMGQERYQKHVAKTVADRNKKGNQDEST